MHAKGHIRPFHAALFNHGLGAFAHFLARLEDQAHITAQALPLLPQKLGRSQQPCHMQVMAAGVHQPFCFTGKGQSGFLLNGQRIHIGPQSHRLSRTASCNLGHHPGRA